MAENTEVRPFSIAEYELRGGPLTEQKARLCEKFVNGIPCVVLPEREIPIQLNIQQGPVRAKPFIIDPDN